jgi:hypothetical protein
MNPSQNTENSLNLTKIEKKHVTLSFLKEAIKAINPKNAQPVRDKIAELEKELKVT